MLERKNSLKRSGFKRPVMERKPVVAAPIPEHLRRRVSTGPAKLFALPKTQREENPHYRAMARDKDCQLRVPRVCCFDRSTTVLAHSNWHDKGGARKASDFWGVWGCFTCHSWLDSGKASGEEKRAAFDAALARMEKELEKIVAYQMGDPKDRDAAWWALERIRAVAP